MVISYRAACAAALHRVAVPYKLHVNKLLQILRVDDLCHCRIQIALLRKKKNPSRSRPQQPF